ncbi:hypothetical protein MRX96_031467 [Rhipicephalus microplus]
MNFASTSDDVQAADDVRPGQDMETAAAWAALEDACIVPESVAPSDYVDADTDVIVYEELSDAKIFRSGCAATATTNSLDNNEAVHGVPAVPTSVIASQVMDSLGILHCFLSAHDDDVTMQLLTECEKRILLLLVQKRTQSKSDFSNLWK